MIARDKSGTERVKTGQPGIDQGQGHNWSNAKKKNHYCFYDKVSAMINGNFIHTKYTFIGDLLLIYTANIV